VPENTDLLIPIGDRGGRTKHKSIDLDTSDATESSLWLSTKTKGNGPGGDVNRFPRSAINRNWACWTDRSQLMPLVEGLSSSAK